MSRPRHRHLVAAAAALAALVLAGCATTLEPAALDPGTCLAEAVDNQPVRASAIDCEQPHLFDVIATLGAWPGTASAIEASDARTIYERLIRREAGDDLVIAFEGWAMPQCAAAMNELIGATGIVVGDSDVTALRFEPAAPYWLSPSLATPSRFAAGDHTVLCAVGWPTPQGELRAVGYDRAVTIAELLSGVFPLELRECFDLDASGLRGDTDCTAPHSGQVLARFDALATLGPSWVGAVNPDNGRAADYRSADQACAAIAGQLLPEGTLGHRIDVWTDIVATDAWAYFDGRVANGGRYPLSCSVVAPGNDLLMGDAFAGDVTVTAR